MLWGRFNGGFGFRVATSPDGLRLRHGLLEQRTQTVPPGRVQAIRLSQGLLWRKTDWWQVQVNIAGYSGGEGENNTESGSTLLQVGSRYDAISVLALVLPDLGVREPENPWTVIDTGLSASGPDNGYLVAPRRSRWVDPIGWRRSGVRVTEQALLIRRGVLGRSLDIVPHARTQSLGVSQGPVQRRLNLASFSLHSTPGPVTPVAAHLDTGTAAQLLAEQAVRAEGARNTSGPERWMALDD
jgi:putative membrane protein